MRQLANNIPRSISTRTLEAVGSIKLVVTLSYVYKRGSGCYVKLTGNTAAYISLDMLIGSHPVTIAYHVSKNSATIASHCTSFVQRNAIAEGALYVDRINISVDIC